MRRADLRGGSVRDPFGRGRSTGSDRFSFHPFLFFESFLPFLFENNLDNFEFFRIFDIRSEEELIIISLFRFEIV